MNRISKIYYLPRRIKQLFFAGIDLVFIPLSVWFALNLRYGDRGVKFNEVDYYVLAVFTVISIVIFATSGLYRAIVRYMGQQAMLTIIRAISLSALVLALTMLLARSSMPRSTPFLYWGIALMLIGGSRLAVRSLYHYMQRQESAKVVIYGAGDSGRQLHNALHHGGQFTPVAFIDDDPALQGRVINGIRVHAFADLSRLVKRWDVSDVLLALPTIGRARRAEIVNSLEPLAVCVKTIPSFERLVLGTARVDEILDIDIEDLLGRNIVSPSPGLLRHCIENKVVMVTGGGGSIGSELCRQIIRNQPCELILMDSSEYGLYQINRELTQLIKEMGVNITLVPLLGSVQNGAHLKSIFLNFGVQTIYHAAAYKHVPLVEFNISEGVRNNVFGTLAAARAAAAAKVETFVLISTDKAVRPTNVMGASKRMAELVLQAFANKYANTQFCMVRFGNVLGSSGSVVPLFREQIKSGGPVTVTHPDVVRYFMTIPEAAQLVLQASAMCEGGDVFVLDMGEPVKIIDLAKRMVRLMGHEVKDAAHPDGDMEIAYSGLRPGEKLNEELLVGNNVTGTGHPMIMRAQEEYLSEEVIDAYLKELAEACERHDCGKIQKILLAAVTGFDAKDGISDALWLRCIDNKRATDNIITGSFPKIG
ncbi:MAG: nucleoside-diphosphate sugar epimerase/dehydratase [Spongiibacteraceae bacterium]